MQTPDTRPDWRRPRGKEALIRKTFPAALPALWWFHFHARRPPTEAELAAVRDAFMQRASVIDLRTDVLRSTALQGNPYVIAVTCSPPTQVCEEIELDGRTCALYLVQSDAFNAVSINFVEVFGEADNPFREPSRSPAP